MTMPSAADRTLAAEPAGGAPLFGSRALAALQPWQRIALAVVFWGNLLCQMGIILTGGVVRLTGSGLGCSTWPNCEPGQFTPRYTPEMGLRPFIEFGNRTLTGVLGVFAIAVLVLSILWLRRKGGGFLVLAALPLVGTALQAIIGMVIVRLHLHPGAVAPHFLVSIGLVVVSSILLARLREGDGRVHRVIPTALMALAFALGAVAAVVLVLGTVVTSSGPHSGDLDVTLRLGLDPRMVSWLHADSVMMFCGLLVGLLIALHLVRTPRRTRRAAWILVAVTAAQGALGYVQYFTGLPEILVGLHMALAAVFTASITWLITCGFSWREQVEVEGGSDDGTAGQDRLVSAEAAAR